MSEFEDQMWQELAWDREDLDAHLERPTFGSQEMNDLYLGVLERAYNNTLALVECRG